MKKILAASDACGQSTATKGLAVGVALLFLAVRCCFAATPATNVRWEGTEITGITSVKLREDGRVLVLYSGGGFSTAMDQLPPDFLASWGLSKDSAERLKSDQQDEAQAGLEGAVRNGMFREVEGVVYDLRKYQPEWSYFRQAKLVKILSREAIFDVSSDPSVPTLIVVMNLPELSRHTQRLDINAKLVSTYDYLDNIHNTRKLRLYDVGRSCGREEIPEAITAQNQAWAALAGFSGAKGGVLSKLPDGDSLKCSGTGFFISEDGYLLTNWHVVEEATRVKVKCKKGVFAAEVIKSDRVKDLALLKINGQFQPLTFAPVNDVSLGESAFTIGFPNLQLQGLEPKFTDGRISSLSGIRDDPNRYQISVPVQPGNSGGPLVDRNGKVIGVVVARLNDLGVLRTSGSLPQNVNYAIKGDIASNFARQLPGVHFSSGKNCESQEQAVKNTEEAVAMVLVY
jgi:S1-C subfamily serine protease